MDAFAKDQLKKLKSSIRVAYHLLLRRVILTYFEPRSWRIKLQSPGPVEVN